MKVILTMILLGPNSVFNTVIEAPVELNMKECVQYAESLRKRGDILAYCTELFILKD